MAGMLPGVESARRRRLPGTAGWCDPSSIVGTGFGSARIRLSKDTHLTPTSFLQANQSEEDEKLGGAAREAKQRLDGRLRGHLKKEIRRQNSQERLNSVGRREITTPIGFGMENMQSEVFGLKKNGLKRLSWGRIRLGWKSSKQAECAICLDEYKANEKLIHLRCAHRFHSECLLPWLENNAHCPCCRAIVFGSG